MCSSGPVSQSPALRDGAGRRGPRRRQICGGGWGGSRGCGGRVLLQWDGAAPPRGVPRVAASVTPARQRSRVRRSRCAAPCGCHTYLPCAQPGPRAPGSQPLTPALALGAVEATHVPARSPRRSQDCRPCGVTPPLHLASATPCGSESGDLRPCPSSAPWSEGRAWAGSASPA